MHEFTEGQKVTIEDHYQGVLEIATVSRLLKRKMVLSNGKEWRSDGLKPYGISDSWYTGPSVRPYKNDDQQKLQRSRNFSLVRKFTEWSHLEDSELMVVAAICKTVYGRLDKGILGSGNRSPDGSKDGRRTGIRVQEQLDKEKP